MKAAVCHQFRSALSIEEVKLRPPAGAEIEVAVAACAICHSDLAYVDGAWGGTLPILLGHEAAGRVSALGPDAQGFAVGDPVLVTLIRSCGECPACTDGDPTSCDHAWDKHESPLSLADGRAVTKGMNTAAFAERVLAHPSQLVKLPEGIDMAVASLLSCGVITGFGAVVNTAKVRAGQSVVVIGAGGVGLNTIQAAALAGASPVIALDIADEKLVAAVEFGATHVIRADAPDAADLVRALNGGRGVDYVFVTVGAPAVFQSAPDLLAARGAMVMVGMPASGVMVSYEPVMIAAMNQRLIGSRMGQTHPQRDLPKLVDLYLSGRLKLDELVSGRYPLDRINEAIAATRAGKSRRNVIVFGDPT